MMQVTQAIEGSVLDEMVKASLAEKLDATTVPAFINGPGLAVLLFAGMKKNVSEGHDVAVAVRELARSYPMARVGVFSDEDETILKSQFRVVVFPSLVLLAGGKILEVLPRVRDWKDYEQAFQRYLGRPMGATLN